MRADYNSRRSEAQSSPRKDARLMTRSSWTDKTVKARDFWETRTSTSCMCNLQRRVAATVTQSMNTDVLKIKPRPSVLDSGVRKLKIVFMLKDTLIMACFSDCTSVPAPHWNPSASFLRMALTLGWESILFSEAAQDSFLRLRQAEARYEMLLRGES